MQLPAAFLGNLPGLYNSGPPELQYAGLHLASWHLLNSGLPIMIYIEILVFLKLDTSDLGHA